MLHSYPKNHLIWPDAALALTEKHTVVLADLLDYGKSAKPAPDSGGFFFSRGSMTSDQAGLDDVVARYGLNPPCALTRAGPRQHGSASVTTRLGGPLRLGGPPVLFSIIPNGTG